MNTETAIADKIIEIVRGLSRADQEKTLQFIEKIERADETGESPQNRQEKTEAEKKAARRRLIGMFRSGNSDVSERAEEILMAEIDKQSGWTVKK